MTDDSKNISDGLSQGRYVATGNQSHLMISTFKKIVQSDTTQMGNHARVTEKIGTYRRRVKLTPSRYLPSTRTLTSGNMKNTPRCPLRSTRLYGEDTRDPYRSRWAEGCACALLGSSGGSRIGKECSFSSCIVETKNGISSSLFKISFDGQRLVKCKFSRVRTPEDVGRPSRSYLDE